MKSLDPLASSRVAPQIMVQHVNEESQDDYWSSPEINKEETKISIKR